MHTTTYDQQINYTADPRFIEFRPCTLAASALGCVLEELLPLDKSNVHLSDILRLLPHNQTVGAMNKCFKIMEEHMADLGFNNSPLTTLGSSLVSVMESERTDPCDCCCDLFSTTNRRKRKRDAMARLMLEDHVHPHLITIITPPQEMVL
ncbi:hypothetical protein ACLOJK_012728 [Asimina triloba]